MSELFRDGLCFEMLSTTIKVLPKLAAGMRAIGRRNRDSKTSDFAILHPVLRNHHDYSYPSDVQSFLKMLSVPVRFATAS